jgi:TonB family protein
VAELLGQLRIWLSAIKNLILSFSNMKCVKLILLIVFTTPFLSFAQQGGSDFYTAHGVKTDEANSVYFEVVKKTDGVHIDSILTYHTKTKKLRSKEVRNRKGDRVDYYYEYYESGRLKTKSFYKDGVIQDNTIHFHENGKTEAMLLNQSWDKKLEMIPDPKIIHYWDSTGAQIVKNGEGNCGCYYTWGDTRFREQGIVKDGKRDGEWKGFRNDTLQYTEVYNNGILVKGMRIAGGKQIEYTKSHEAVAYTGGLQALGKFIGKNLRYPADARRLGMEGQVRVGFVVRKSGTLDSFSIVNTISKSLDEEAMRVVKLMPDWTPLTIKGIPVDSRFVLPIRFKLEN